VKIEYDIDKYKQHKDWLEDRWGKREVVFVKHLLDFFNKPEETEFNIEISNYGSLGHYNSNTNTITINLNTNLDPIETIKHEMIHITLEPFIRKYSIKHEQKEDIVNTIFDIIENI
jgi:hypothetical protein